MANKLTLKGSGTSKNQRNVFRGNHLQKKFTVTLVFMWSTELRERFNYYFWGHLCHYKTKFSFWRGDWALGYHSVKFRHFPNISVFSKILSLISFSNSWGNSYIQCLSVIMVHCFTCGEMLLIPHLSVSEKIGKAVSK